MASFDPAPRGQEADKTTAHSSRSRDRHRLRPALRALSFASALSLFLLAFASVPVSAQTACDDLVPTDGLADAVAGADVGDRVCVEDDSSAGTLVVDESLQAIATATLLVEDAAATIEPALTETTEATEAAVETTVDAVDEVAGSVEPVPDATEPEATAETTLEPEVTTDPVTEAVPDATQ